MMSVAPRAVTSSVRDQELARLLQKAAGGDESAFAKVYDLTSPVVFGLAGRILRDRAAAEDVTIEVYLQAHRLAGAYDRERGSPLAWLLTLTRSRALDRLRAERRRWLLEEPLEASVLPSDVPGPADATEAALDRRRIQVALAALPAPQRELIELAYFGGLTQSEIAAQVALPLGTVKTRMRAGMMALRDALLPISSPVAKEPA